MAGTIALTSEVRWSQSSWAYHWVLDFLIDRVTDPAAAATLRDVDDANLGWVDVAEFEPVSRREILALLKHDLVPDAEARLALDKPDREEWIEVIRSMQDLASGVVE